MTRTIRVARTQPRCRALGPGTRFVIWVQGCPLRCVGCVAPEWLPFEGGEDIETSALARTIIEADVDGMTFSGGEPTAQPEAVSDVIDRVAAARPDMTTMLYSGFSIEQLRRSAATADLLRRLDILIDGPYVQAAATGLRWRGSSNQRAHLLTARVQHLRSQLDQLDRMIEVTIALDGDVGWAGIPPPSRRLLSDPPGRRSLPAPGQRLQVTRGSRPDDAHHRNQKNP